jgi:hypothetical protein
MRILHAHPPCASTMRTASGAGGIGLDRAQEPEQPSQKRQVLRLSNNFKTGVHNDERQTQTQAQENLLLDGFRLGGVYCVGGSRNRFRRR